MAGFLVCFPPLTPLSSIVLYCTVHVHGKLNLFSFASAEVKQLKSLVRNIVDPSRDLGHVDRALGKEHKSAGAETTPVAAATTTAAAAAKTVATDVNTQAGMGASGKREGEDENEKGEGDKKTCEDCK